MRGLPGTSGALATDNADHGQLAVAGTCQTTRLFAHDADLAAAVPPRGIPGLLLDGRDGYIEQQT
jgi:hypothetical protein